MLRTLEPDRPTDFDFFLGSWTVSHQRLRSRLVGDTSWERFDGLCCCQPILGGFGNVDDNELDLPAGRYRAATLRSFDVRTRTWSIWWLDGRAAGALDVPVVGRFDKGVGRFFAQDRLGDQPIVVRFLWTVPEPDRPRWEQAFSADAGQTWETNWIMSFTRALRPSAPG